MGIVLKNNLGAIRTLNRLNATEKSRDKNFARISGGVKITGAQDDASAYAISERMRVRIRALDQANQNVQNDMSLMRTAEGAVANTVEVLKSLKEKAINAANDSNTDQDRATLQKEIDQLIDQIDDNALVTFNGKYMLTGSSVNAVARNSNSQTWSRTILFNKSLATGTGVADNLTTLKNRAGDSLGIQVGDIWKSTYVINGTVMTNSGTVARNTRLVDALLTGVYLTYVDKDNVNASTSPIPYFLGYDNGGQPFAAEEEGIRLISAKEGLDGHIAGFSFVISDGQGNINKAAVSALNAFTTVKHAVNNTGSVGPTNMFNFQIGSEANQAMRISFSDMRAHALGIKSSTGQTISVATKDYANAAISVFDNAINKALNQQTDIGAVLARLEYTSSNLTISNENVQAAESTIRDADMAKEMTEYTKNNVLLQATQSMLAQANQNSSSVLSLIQ